MFRKHGLDSYPRETPGSVTLGKPLALSVPAPLTWKPSDTPWLCPLRASRTNTAWCPYTKEA